MTIGKFCKGIANIGNLTNAQKALAILWHMDQEESGVQKSAGDLAVVLRQNRIANPNTTKLAGQLKSSGCVYSTKGKFHLRQDKMAEVRSWVEGALTDVPAEIPVCSQFLDENVWRKTRGYIEKVCVQLNRAHHEGLYDCAAVMVRRIIETLIIEAYEAHRRESEIKAGDGNYYMLGEMVSRAIGASGLSLGREVKKGLDEIKKSGDRSAHNRRYNARKSDLDAIRDFLRLAFEELANIANLYGESPKKG